MKQYSQCIPNCYQLFRNNLLKFGILVPEILFQIVTNYYIEFRTNFTKKYVHFYRISCNFFPNFSKYSKQILLDTNTAQYYRNSYIYHMYLFNIPYK